MASSVYISLDIFNISCSRTVKDSIILLSSDNESSYINDIEKSSYILQNQNAAEYIHEPRNETDDDLVKPCTIWCKILTVENFDESGLGKF